MSFFSRFFSRRQVIPDSPADADVELSQGTTNEPTSEATDREIGDSNNTQENNSPNEDDEVVVVPQETPSANNNTLDIEALVKRRLFYIKVTSRILLFLTVLQIMSTLGTEHIHFLSLFSLFVPWTGLEGAKERNFAYLRVFYWGCWIMIPANFFHFISFDQFVDQVLAAGLDENLKQELLFNHTLFNVVTIMISIGMFFSLFWIRQVSVLIHSLRNFMDHDFLDIDRRHSRERSGGALSSDEISAISSFKIQAEDISSENANEKDVCVICQDDFQTGELAKRLNCRHMFHAQCIDAWLERSSSCPICNGDVRSIV